MQTELLWQSLSYDFNSSRLNYSALLACPLFPSIFTMCTGGARHASRKKKKKTASSIILFYLYLIGNCSYSHQSLRYRRAKQLAQCQCSQQNWIQPPGFSTPNNKIIATINECYNCASGTVPNAL